MTTLLFAGPIGAAANGQLTDQFYILSRKADLAIIRR
jgi:hypothetical protein